VAFFAVGLEHNGRNVAVVGVRPVRLRHEAVVTPVLIGIKPGVLHPRGVVHKALEALVALPALSEALILPKSLVVLSKALIVLPKSLVIWDLALIAPLVILVGILPLIVLISHLARLVGVVAVVSPLVWLVVSPLVWLVVAPLALSLVVWIEPLIRVIVEALALALTLTLTLVAPHSCKDY
jgi:hypothetical protein